MRRGGVHYRLGARNIPLILTSLTMELKAIPPLLMQKSSPQNEKFSSVFF